MSRRVLIAIVAATATVRAQPSSRDAATLFDQGRELARQQRYGEACERFAASYALDHAIGTELNLGDCQEHLGHHAQAWHFFDLAATEFKVSNDAKRSAYARGRADALLARLGTIVIHVADSTAAGLAISIGGRAAKPAPEIIDHFDPGEITVQASLPGHASFTRRTRAVAGASVIVDVPSFGTGADPAIAAAPDVRASGNISRSSGRRRGRVRGATALGVAGGVATITGVAIGLVARGRYDNEFSNGDCLHGTPDPLCNNPGLTKQNAAITLAKVGTGVGIAGLALVSVGAVVYLTAPRDLAIAPATSGRDVSLAVSGRF